MIILVTALHILICVFLVIVVLLQSGKAADLAGAFGGMGSQTAFGPRGSATVLSKATTVAAALFMVTSLSLSILASRSSGSVSSVTERVKPMTSKAPAPNGQAPAGRPSVTTTTVGPGGVKGPSTTVPLQIPSQSGVPAKR